MGRRKYLIDRLFISFLILLISFTICVSVDAAGIDKKNASKSGWSFAAYNFGSLGKLSPEHKLTF